MNEVLIMVEYSKKMIVRRSFQALSLVGFVLVSSTPVFADTGDAGYEDVGVADIYDEIFDSDIDHEVGEDPDAGFEPDVDSDGGFDLDADVDFDVDFDADSDVAYDGGETDIDVEHGDVDQATDISEDISEDTDAVSGDSGDNNPPETDFLFVELGVEVKFDGDAPDTVKFGLSGNLGDVAPVDVSVSEQGLAVWEIEELQAGAWVLSATAEGFEPVHYRFVAGDLSQMLIRISMVKLGSHAETTVESGWGCSAVAADAMPSIFILFAALLSGLWIQRRRKL